MMDKLLFTDNPSLIQWKADEMIGEGYNLSGDPFVFGGCFCQWMTPMQTMNEYKLVSAFLPSELETLVNRWESDGFIRVFATLNWNGQAFQWMSRYNGGGAKAQFESVVVGVRSYEILGDVSFSGSHTSFLPGANS